MLLSAAVVSARPGEALALAPVCCSFAFMALPVANDQVAQCRRSRLAPIGVAIAAGGVTAVGPDRVRSDDFASVCAWQYFFRRDVAPHAATPYIEARTACALFTNHPHGAVKSLWHH